jgi:hypothetical protein
MKEHCALNEVKESPHSQASYGSFGVNKGAINFNRTLWTLTQVSPGFS